MSKEEDKIKNSKRRYKDETAIEKQVKIAKQYGLDSTNKSLTEPHRLSKHHALNCGKPKCVLCSNPRHNKISKNKLTTQEKRMFQDIDSSNNRHSNGNAKDE